MADVTYTAEAWVWLEVRGQRQGEYGRDDNGLTMHMLEWMQAERIDWRSQRTGGGVWIGRIPVADAPRVLAWLDEHGAARENAE